MKTSFREVVLPHHKKHLAFICVAEKCNSWLYLTRDLKEDTISLATGIQRRLFVCYTCKKVYEFEGRRGILFTKTGIRLSRTVRMVIPPELKQLMEFQKNLERILRRSNRK